MHNYIMCTLYCSGNSRDKYTNSASGACVTPNVKQVVNIKIEQYMGHGKVDIIIQIL